MYRVELPFKWKANTKTLVFPCNSHEKTQEMKSPIFERSLPSKVCGGSATTWYLLLQKTFEESYSIYLCLKGVSASKDATTRFSKCCIADCVFSVLDSKTDEIQYSQTAPSTLCRLFGSNGGRCGLENFTLYHKKDKFIPDGILTVQVVASLIFCNDPIHTINEARPIPSNNVLDGVQALHKDKTFADVVIRCGDKEFQAHKAILASQSPVFSKMLLKSSVIKIANTDPNVISSLLDFLYIGKAPNLHTLAKNLLEAAFKYKLPQLAVLCENELVLNLYTDNLLEMVQCADQCGATNLKKACLRKIKNSAVVFESDAWKDFKTNSEEKLVIEVLEFND